MDFTLESLVVAIFAILPGFISTAVRVAVKPAERSSAGEWVAGSIVSSIALNAVALSIFLYLNQALDFTKPISNLSAEISSLSGSVTLQYLAILYAVAVGWGVISGIVSDRFAPRALAHRLRLTPVSPLPNVFCDTLNKLVRTPQNRRLRGKSNEQVPWLRIGREQAVIFGRVRRSSVDFQLEQPIEVFLSPFFVLKANQAKATSEETTAPANSSGLYLRLEPKDMIEIIVAPASWTPICPAVPRKANPILGC